MTLGREMTDVINIKMIIIFLHIKIVETTILQIMTVVNANITTEIADIIQTLPKKVKMSRDLVIASLLEETKGCVHSSNRAHADTEYLEEVVACANSYIEKYVMPTDYMVKPGMAAEREIDASSGTPSYATNHKIPESASMRVVVSGT